MPLLNSAKIKASVGKQEFHLCSFNQALVLKSYLLHWSRNRSCYSMKIGKERLRELRHSLGKHL